MEKTKLRSLFLLFAAVVTTIMSGCNTEEVEFQTPDMTVSESVITAINNKMGEVSFEIKSNRAWKVVIPEDADWVIATPTSGSGDAKITLKMLDNDDILRETTISVATTTVYATVKLVQPGAFLTTTMFNMTFGTSAPSSGSTPIATYTDWGTSGPSASTAKFTGDGDLRATSPSTGTYKGSSGGANLFLSGPNKLFQISDLNVNTGVATPYKLKFGCYKFINASESAPYDVESLKVQYSIDSGATWTDLTYTRAQPSNAWGLGTTETFTLPANAKTLSFKFTCGSGQPRIDDITLTAMAEVTIAPVPAVTTADATNLTTTTATIGGSYTYAGSINDITAVGVTYAKTSEAADDTKYTTVDLVGSLSSPFSIDISGLEDATNYTFKAYVKIGADTYYYGNAKTFTTLTTYIPPTPVATYIDDFNSITTAFVPYTGENWAFGSNNNTASNNWRTSTYLNSTTKVVEKYIQISTAANVTPNVVAYAMMPPVNISGATSKKLIYNSAFYFTGGTFNNSKLEVVASTNFAGNFNSATWTVIDDASKTSTDPINTWTLRTVDMAAVASGAFATATAVNIAFRYSGKVDTYRIDDVFFGYNDPQPIWGTPFINPETIFAIGAEVAAGTDIVIPYKFASGSVTPTVAVTGAGAGTLTVASSAQTLTNDSNENVIKLALSGTPQQGDILFTINGIAGLTNNTVAATGVSEEILSNTSLAGLGTIPSAPSYTFSDNVILTRVAGDTDTAPNLSYTGSSSSLWCGDWHKAGAAWVIKFPIAEALSGNVKLETSVFGVNASPKNWLAQYSVDGATWVDGATPQNSYQITVTSTPANKIALTFNIPSGAGVAPGGFLYIKLYPDPSSNTSVNGATIGTSSVNSRLAGSFILKKL